MNKNSMKGFLPSSRRSGGASASSEMVSTIEEPSQFYPGDQQFFYRFIVLLDSHRLCAHLSASMFAEIHRLCPLASCADEMSPETASSPKSPEVNSATSNSKESFLHRIIKLKILGKFLGLLHFWPHWTSLMDRSKMGPLLVQADQGSRNRLLARSPLDLLALVEKSIRLSCLSLTVPWVVEYLRMMVWDSSFKVTTACHITAILLPNSVDCDPHPLLLLLTAPNPPSGVEPPQGSHLPAVPYIQVHSLARWQE